MSSSERLHQTHDLDSVSETPVIGLPVHFVAGQFAGQTVRAELQELQKADLGRKYARVDRRPLDPPPVVLLRLFYVHGVGTPNQWEEEVENYQDIQNCGIMCMVDLFPVSESISAHNWQAEERTERTYPAAPFDQGSTTSLVLPTLPVGRSVMGANSTRDTLTPVRASGPPAPNPSRPALSGSPRPESVVFHVGNHAITEGAKLTPALIGGRFVESTLAEYQGRKALVFVFADLAVKMEGVFMLRYRMFDILSFVSGTSDHPIQAELYGGLFKVYSTRDFPGLQASTELTKALSRFGVPLTVRDTEPKSKGKNAPMSSTLPLGQDIGKPQLD